VVKKQENKTTRGYSLLRLFASLPLYLFTSLLLSFSAGPVAAQTVSFKITPPAEKPKLIETFQLRLELTCPSEYTVRPDTSIFSNDAFELEKIKNEATEKDIPYKKWIREYIKKEKDYIIQGIEVDRLRNYADIFKHMGEGYIERMSSDIKIGERENLSKDELSKRISREALFAKIKGLCWKMNYMIHGVDIKWKAEKSSCAQRIY